MAKGQRIIKFGPCRCPVRSVELVNLKQQFEDCNESGKR